MPPVHALAPEFASQPRFTLPSNRWLLRGVNLLLRLQRRGFTWSERVAVRIHSVRGETGSVVPVFEIAPRELSGVAPAILDFHGGGFFLSYAAGHLRYAERYALDGGCRVFFPDYRLSIDHPFPAGFDDCYATLAWVHAEAEALGVDCGRVLLLGDSAGGALAAGVAQKALDRREHPVLAQLLIYPVTDCDTKTPSATQFHDTPLWKTASNRNMWKVYLAGHEPWNGPGTSPPPYAAPLHRERFEGLPPAHIELAEFDPLRDEGRLYAEALEKAGVAVETRLVQGAIHGYDLVDDSPTAETVYAERREALRRLLGGA